MQPGTRSLTADLVAMMRAAHVVMDDEPKILDDKFALKLCGLPDSATLHTAMAGMEQNLSSKFPDVRVKSILEALRAGISVRSRMAEQRLMEAVERGISQYVILGAGLDSSAYRLADVTNRLRVFEVDFPATQQWKLARLEEIDPHFLELATFVSVDFETESLFEKLQENGFDPAKPTFFSWLGVVWYLSDEAIFATLENIASLECESEVVFEYPIAAELVYPVDRPVVEMLKQAGAERGEPLRPGFDPADLTRRVKELGFDVVEDLSPADIQERYFQDRADNLRMPGIGHFMIARRASAK